MTEPLHVMIVADSAVVRKHLGDLLTKAGMQTETAGAVGFVIQPKLGLRDFLEEGSNGIGSAVRAAAKANMGALRLPRTAPGMVVVQHMPPKFTASLAARLRGLRYAQGSRPHRGCATHRVACRHAQLVDERSPCPCGRGGLRLVATRKHT